MSFPQQGGGGYPPIRAATVMGPDGRPVPLIHISSRPRSDSPPSPPPVGGIVTASSLTLPFDIDPNDPLFHQQESEMATAQSSGTESQAQQDEVEASAPPSQQQAQAHQQDSSSTETEHHSVKNDDDMSVSSYSSTEHMRRRRTISRVGSDEADSSDDEQFIQSPLREAVARKAAGDRGRDVSTDNATEHRPLSQDQPKTNDDIEDQPTVGDSTSRKKAPELLEQGESREEEEEESLLSKIDDDILAEEERELLAKIERSIDAAQAKVLPVGACVLSIGYPEGEGSNMRVREVIVRAADPVERPVKRRKLSHKNTGGNLIMDVVDWSTRVSVTKKLPKVLGRSPPLELTNTIFRAEIVAPILARDPLPRRRLTGQLNPIKDDPHSLSLEMRGHPDVIRKVMDKTTAYIRSFQSLQSKMTPAAGKLQSEITGHSRETEKREDARVKAIDKPAPASVAYRHFQEKYSEVVALEYKGAVHVQSVYKYMWASHKKQLGASCSPDCPCVSKLSSITEDVVANFMTAQMKKDPTWENKRGLRVGESPVGFVSHFAPKYYPLLAKQFQGENPQQLLDRLVLMFNMHRKQRRYGVTCGDDCPCGEGWEVVFNKGYLRPGETKERTPKAIVSRSAVVIPRKQSAAIPRKQAVAIPRKESTAASAHKESVTATPRLPLKRKTIERDGSVASLSHIPSSVSQKASEHTARKSNPENMTIPRKSKTRQAEPAPSTGGPSDPKTYCIEYDAGEPLGFHCNTESKKGQAFCIIDSVSPQGQAKDSRLQVGTAVISVAAGKSSTPMSISSYKDLKLTFERAKSDSSRLRVYFINTHVKKRGSLGSILSQTKGNSLISSGGSWSTNNVWHGTKAGWAGGAPGKGVQDRKSSQSKPSQPVDAPQSLDMALKTMFQRVVPTGEPVIHLSEGRQPQKLTAQRYVWRSTMAQALHRRRTKPTSVLKESRYTRNAKEKPADRPTGVVRSLIGSALPPAFKKSPNKSVRFPEACVQKMYFNDNDLAYRLGNLVAEDCKEEDMEIDNEAPRLELSEEELPTIPTREQLFDAVQNKTVGDVIHLLERGAPFEEPDDHGMTAKDVVKAMETELGSTRDGPLFEQKSKDIEGKKKALIIYVTARFAIDQARFLKAWVEFELTIDGLRNLVLTRLGAEHRSSNTIYCRAALFIVGGRDQQEVPLRDLPGEELSETVDWNKQTATVTFNPNIDGARSRCLAITLEKGCSTDPSGPVRLGRLEIPISRLNEESQFDVSREIETSFSSTEYLQSATIIMHVKKGHLKDIDRDRKKIQAAKKLNEAVDWIRRFNEKSYLDNVGASIKGHIAPAQCNFTSLLHGAVYVSDVQMVESLLRLGADPLSRSVDGSAQKLASAIAEKLASTRLGDGTANEEDENEDEIVDDSSHPSVAIVRILADATKDKSTDTGGMTDLASSEKLPNKSLPELPSATESYGQLSAQSDLQEPENFAPSTNTDMSQPDSDLRVPKKRKQAAARGSAMPGHYGQDEHSALSISISSPRSHTTGTDKSISVDQGASKSASYDDPAQASDGSPEFETVPFDWTLEKDQEVCRYFRTGGGCKRGVECDYAHAKPPVGHPLKDEQLTRGLTVPALNPSFTRYRESTNQNGQTVVTAAYVDLYENITYYAEGGKTVGRNRHGVNWYDNKDDAYAALYQVLVYWKHDLDKVQIRRQTEGSQQRLLWEPPRRELGSGEGSQTQGPVLKPPQRELASSGLHPPKAAGESAKPMFGEEAYFDQLRRSNLANLYTQVFSHLPHFQNQMRKTWWTEYSSSDGTVAVQLKLPDNVRVSGISVFNSWKVGGGVVGFEGRAYHQDLKSAKSSAFYYLLVKAAEEGLISRDMTKLADGRPLSLGFS